MRPEVAHQVRPAELAALDGEVVVGPPAVRAGDAAELLAQERLGLALVAVGGDAEDRRARGERSPERAPVAARPPAGLIDVEYRGGAALAQQLPVGHRKRRRRALQDGIDRAGAEPGAEQLTGQLDRVPAGDAVAHDQGGDRRLEARAEGTRRHLGRKVGARDGPAVRAAQALQAVLAQDDRDRG